MSKKYSFTLLEMLVVVIIIGVLAMMGVANQGKAVEVSRMKQAGVILRMIRDAQMSYQMRNGVLMTCASMYNCRTILDVNAPLDLNDSYWSVSATNTAPAAALITRVGGQYSGCQYSIYLNANDAVWQSAGVCP